MKNHGIFGRLPKSLGVTFGLVLLAMLWLTFVAASWAKAADDEYNFNWLDPEKKIYVLQNRKYLKAERPMISLLFGPGSSNAYRNTYGLSGRLAYYFSEWLGLEVFHTYVSNSENKTFEQLRLATSNLVPVVREIRSQTGVALTYVPWYAKINVFNSILYFDWYFSAGVGVLNTQLDLRTSASIPSNYLSQSFTGLFFGTGHLFHLSQLVLIRLDVSGAYYRAPLYGATGDSTWYSNYLYSAGVGLKL